MLANISEEECGPEDVQVALAVDLARKLDPEATEERVTAALTSNRLKGSGLDGVPDLDLEWLKGNRLEEDVSKLSEYVKQRARDFTIPEEL